MAKKLAPIKKNVAPKNHEEVKSDYVVEKSNYGTKEVVKEKGQVVEDSDTVDDSRNIAGALPEGKATVGLSKGVTLNLGNYQSARISCWISRTVNEDDKTVMDTLADISQLIDEQIEFESEEILSGQEK